MLGDGQITAVGLTQKTGAVTVSFFASAFKFSRQIEVIDDGLIIAKITIPVDGTTVRFMAPIGRILTIHPTEPPSKISDLVADTTDPRTVSIKVSGFDVES